MKTKMQEMLHINCKSGREDNPAGAAFLKKPLLILLGGKKTPLPYPTGE